MAKYISSPFGNLTGKLGDSVGGSWRGVPWVRKKIYPPQRGTLEMYRLLKAGSLSLDDFSFKQMNIRRVILQVLGCIGRRNMPNMINPIWTKICTEKSLRMTGINLFTKANLTRLWASMEHQDEEYDARTNKPDMVKLVVSDGNLEPTPSVLACTYDYNTGALRIEWDTKSRGNGQPDDYAFIMAYNEPVVDSNWRPNGWLFGTAVAASPASQAMRSDGNMEITIPKRLAARDIKGYVFFKDKAGKIGYSPSKGKQAVRSP